MSIAPAKAVMSDDLRRLNHKRKQVLVVGIALGAALLAIVDSSWRSEWPRAQRGIQWTGLMPILVGIFGRTWCALYIGGMKLRGLVTNGPYSVVPTRSISSLCSARGASERSREASLWPRRA